jgi:hypothetical protein
MPKLLVHWRSFLWSLIIEQNRDSGTIEESTKEENNGTALVLGLSKQISPQNVEMGLCFADCNHESVLFQLNIVCLQSKEWKGWESHWKR